MALSDYERQIVFEVFDVPNASSVLYIDGAFATGATANAGAILVSRTEINALIDALTPEKEQRARELLTAWLRVSTQGTKIRPNAANEGVDVSPARDRALIRRRLRMVVPIVTADEMIGGDGMQLA